MTQSTGGRALDDEDLQRRTERVLGDMFLSMRSLHLALGIAHLVLQPASYRRARLAWLGLGVSAGATAFVATRLRRGSVPTDPVAVVVDVVAQIAAVRLGGAAVAPGHGSGPENIGFLPSTWSAAAISPWSQLPLGIMTTVALAANWGMVGGRLAKRSPWQTAFSTLSLHFGVFGVGAFFARSLRTAAAAAMEARATALADAEQLAIEQSRREVQARVHQRALRALREIRDVLPVDRTAARTRARAEAQALRSLISEREAGDRGALEGAVAAAVGGAIAAGVAVDLQVREEIMPPSEILSALRGLLLAALDNVARHSLVDRVVVRVVADARGTRVTIRDRGVGVAVPDTDWAPPSVVRGAAGRFSITCTSGLGQGTRIVGEAVYE